jgi:hypothetical protein
MTPLKKNVSISLCELQTSNFFYRKVYWYVCTVYKRSFIVLCGILLSGQSFSYGYLYVSHNDNTSIKKMQFGKIWLIQYLIKIRYGIDLKFLSDMNCCMAHFFVTINFSEKCLFMGATFSFWTQVRSEPSRCGHHKDPGQALTHAPLEVHIWYVSHITS